MVLSQLSLLFIIFPLVDAGVDLDAPGLSVANVEAAAAHYLTLFIQLLEPGAAAPEQPALGSVLVHRERSVLAGDRPVDRHSLMADIVPGEELRLGEVPPVGWSQRWSASSGRPVTAL